MAILTPETISAAVAAIATVTVILESLIKFHGKKSEKKMLLYTKYLYIIQQIEIGVSSIKRLFDLKIYEKLLCDQDVVAFAKTHMISEDMIKCIYDFAELSVECLKSADNFKVKRALIFCSSAASLVEDINAFYQGLIVGYQNSDKNTGSVTELGTDRVRELYIRINKALVTLKEQDQIVISDRNFTGIMKEYIIKNRRFEKPVHILYICFLSFNVIILFIIIICISTEIWKFYYCICE